MGIPVLHDERHGTARRCRAARRGAARPVRIPTPTATVRRMVDKTAPTVVEAARSPRRAML